MITKGASRLSNDDAKCASGGVTECRIGRSGSLRPAQRGNRLRSLEPLRPSVRRVHVLSQKQEAPTAPKARRAGGGRGSSHDCRARKPTTVVVGSLPPEIQITFDGENRYGDHRRKRLVYARHTPLNGDKCRHFRVKQTTSPVTFSMFGTTVLGVEYGRPRQHESSGERSDGVSSGRRPGPPTGRSRS